MLSERKFSHHSLYIYLTPRFCLFVVRFLQCLFVCFLCIAVSEPSSVMAELSSPELVALHEEFARQNQELEQLNQEIARLDSRREEVKSSIERTKHLIAQEESIANAIRMPDMTRQRYIELGRQADMCHREQVELLREQCLGYDGSHKVVTSSTDSGVPLKGPLKASLADCIAPFCDAVGGACLAIPSRLTTYCVTPGGQQVCSSFFSEPSLIADHSLARWVVGGDDALVLQVQRYHYLAAGGRDGAQLNITVRRRDAVVLTRAWTETAGAADWLEGGSAGGPAADCAVGEPGGGGEGAAAALPPAAPAVNIADDADDTTDDIAVVRRLYEEVAAAENVSWQALHDALPRAFRLDCLARVARPAAWPP
jgi:hypothetical protein